MAGSVLLLGAPIALAILTFWGSQPLARSAAREQCDTRELAAVVEAPAVSIWIEPTVGTPEQEAQTPVVLPGYILPDDGFEEPVHAGS